MLFISGIELPIEAEEEQAINTARKRCGLCAAEAEMYIYKRAIDARKKRIRFSYTVAIKSRQEERLYQKLVNKGVVLKREEQYCPEEAFGSPVGKPRPVVIGFGPAGAFAALTLAERGFNPLVLERGGAIEERERDVEAFYADGELNPESNIQFGEGGAGTFSDGKLFTRVGDKRCDYVLNEMAELCCLPLLSGQAHPHVGTDKLRQMMIALRKKLISLGGEVMFHTTLIGIESEKGRLTGVITNQGRIPCRRLILAIGHSARDTIKKLMPVLDMESKGFAMGVRIEHLRQDIDRAMYGDYAGHPKLGSAEYRLVSKMHNAFTFCMCPGGSVVAATGSVGGVVTNGMSEYARNQDNSNAALVVPCKGEKNPLSGIAMQEELEKKAFVLAGSRYYAPAQTLKDFAEGRITRSFERIQPSYPVGVTGSDLSRLLPFDMKQRILGAIQEFAGKVSGFDVHDAVITAPETRTSSPIRILRGEDMEALSIKGIFPAGEGAGYAGGILSAAVDGIKAAERASL